MECRDEDRLELLCLVEIIFNVDPAGGLQKEGIIGGRRPQLQPMRVFDGAQNILRVKISRASSAQKSLADF
jgi:hypothetical protein